MAKKSAEKVIDLKPKAKALPRQKTDYPGVVYREAERIGGKGIERVYYIRFKKDGELYEEKVGRQYVDDMTAAKAARIRAERIEGKRLSRKDLRDQQEARKKAEENKRTFTRLWGDYKARHPGLKGIVTDENRFRKHIEPRFGNKEPKELTPSDVDGLKISLIKTHKPATARNVLELLRRLINFGVKKQLCDGISFTIEMPKVNNVITEKLTPDQLNALLTAIQEDTNIQAANFMKMALFTGMRRGELFKLKWDDLDFEGGFIHIIDPKGGPDQVIPLNETAREVLLNHPRAEDSPYVFPGRGGHQRVDIKHQVNRIKERAGLRRDFRALHGLRHVYASMLASSGQVTMYTLQKLLTHKSPTMTQRYAHLQDDTLKSASNLAGTIIKQAWNAQEKKGTEA